MAATAKKHTILSSWAEGTRGGVYTTEYEGDASDSRAIDVPEDTDQKLVNIAIDFSQITSLVLASDVDMTLETNDTGDPDDTIELKANVPMIWNADAYFDNPITADVTKIYLTTATVGAGVFVLEVVHDSTP